MICDPRCTLTRRLEQEKTVAQIANLRAKEEPNAEELESLEHELVRTNAQLIVAEKQLSTITHERVKYGFAYQFDAMQEFGEKLAIIAGYGKHLLQLVQDVPTSPEENQPTYSAHAASTA